MHDSTVLLIGTDEALIEMVCGPIGNVDGLTLRVVAGLDDAYAHDGWDRVALVLIHHDPKSRLNGVVRLLRMIAAARRPVATVILADGLKDEEVTNLLRLGVADVLPRPFDPGRLSYLIEVLTLRARRPAVTRAEAIGPGPGPDDADPMIGYARRVAGQDATILIGGEPGAGKSRLARIVHDLSPRRHGPFATIRCAAAEADGFAEDLLGPTGDPADGRGRVAEACTGTLVLDDVDALAPRAQAVLLGWIEDVDRRGDGWGPHRSPRPRLIATTRLVLGEEVAEGRFRTDLFYRLNVIGLQLAPLRHRRIEIGPIAAEMAEEYGAGPTTLTPEAIEVLEAYPWPGNVLELRDAIESALARGRPGVIGRDDLPERIRDAGLWPQSGAGPALEPPPRSTASTLAQTKQDAEYARITQALEKHGHNRLRTASELGISRMTLYKKLYKYGIIEQEGRDGRRPPGPRSAPETTTSDGTTEIRPA